ncbi:MAG: FHA domain-containing protein [Polyangiaceae bacterium]|nr:FHA domain-containing protein [Polyangiaceae bacterium]
MASPTPPQGMPKVVVSQPAPAAPAPVAHVAPQPAPAQAAPQPVPVAPQPAPHAHAAHPQVPIGQFAPIAASAPAPAPHAAPMVAPAPAPAPAAGSAPVGRSRPESARPPAPVAPQPAGKTRDPAEPATPTPQAPAGASSLRCPTCGTSNPAMYRFCVACGVTLPRDGAKAPAPASGPSPASLPTPPAAPAPIAAAAAAPKPVERAPVPVPVERAPMVAPAAPSAPQAGRLEERIVGAPVVDIAPGGGAPQKPVTCLRCQGQCVAGARFCQFCGAPLGADARPTGRESDERMPPTAREAAAARAGAARGRLVVIEADGSEGMTFSLGDKPLDIGRSEGDILVKEDPYVSPRHARLIPDKGGWIVRDLASTNGVYLRLRKPYLLQDADLLLLGQEVLQFQLVSEPEKGLGHASQHGTLLFGSPITSRSARLCQRTVEGIVRDVYYVHRDETVIGRETGDIVFTADPFLSRRHAMIRRSLARKEGAGRQASRWDFTLTDLDSSNGTFVAIRNEVTLIHGDFVRVGQHLFRVDFA